MINVERKGDQLIWLVADKVDPNTEMTVGVGCQALVIMDGKIIEFDSGITKLLNPKVFMKKTEIRNWAVYGINTEKIFSLLWGFKYDGFTDQSLNGAKVGMFVRGEIKVSIIDSQKMFETLFANTRVLDEEAIADRLRADATSAANSVFRRIAQESKSFNELSSSFCDGTELKTAFTAPLNNYGIRVKHCIACVEPDQKYKEMLDLVNMGVKEGYISNIVNEQTKQGGMAADMINKFRPNNNDSNDNK